MRGRRGIGTMQGGALRKHQSIPDGHGWQEARQGAPGGKGLPGP